MTEPVDLSTTTSEMWQPEEKVEVSDLYVASTAIPLLQFFGHVDEIKVASASIPVSHMKRAPGEADVGGGARGRASKMFLYPIDQKRAS